MAQDVEKQVNDILQSYYKAIDNGVDDAVNKALAEGLVMITGLGGYGNKAVKNYKTGKTYSAGHYRKGFRVEVKKAKPGLRYGTLYNKSWPLTHLLEYGHYTRNGTTRTEAFPHWEQTEKFVDELFERKIEDVIKHARE